MVSTRKPSVLTVSRSALGDPNQRYGILPGIPGQSFGVLTRGVPLEPIVRPAVPAKAYALLDRLLSKRRAPGEETEASITWGQAAEFEVEELRPPEVPEVRGIRVVNPDTGEEESPPDDRTITYTEVNRTTHVTRVTNPQDEIQYVDIEVIDDITFQRSSDGAYIRLVLNNPA